MALLENVKKNRLNPDKLVKKKKRERESIDNIRNKSRTLIQSQQRVFKNKRILKTTFWQ